MHTEQIVYLVGGQDSTQKMLVSAFQKAGFHAEQASYETAFKPQNPPECLVIYLSENDIASAHILLGQHGLEKTKKMLIIDPRNKPCRQFSATADIDDLIFKPVRLKELISRVQLLMTRDIDSHDTKSTVCDEIDFAQRLQELSDRTFSGVFHLHGHDLELEIFFEKGDVKGIKAGSKIQRNAVDAVWRIFPASHTTSTNVQLPAWCQNLNLSISEIVEHAVQANAYFHDKLSEKYSLQSIFRIHAQTYDEAFHVLPKQVRQIIQTFDGSKTLREVFDALNLSEYLIMQIICRLIDEQLIVECEPERNDVSLTDWIGDDTAWSEDDLNSLSGLGLDYSNDALNSGEEATPSAMFFIDQMKPLLKEEKPVLDLENMDETATPVRQHQFMCPVVEEEPLPTYDRATIILHLATAHEKFETAECVIPKDTVYSDEFLEDEFQRDQDTEKSKNADLLSIDESFFFDWTDSSDESAKDIDKALEERQTEEFEIASNKRPNHDNSGESDVIEDDEDEDNSGDSDVIEDDENEDNSGDSDVIEDDEDEDNSGDSDVIEDDEDESDDENDMDGDWFDDENGDALHADSSFSPIDLYKKNHAQELSPEEWKAQTVARLAKEREQKDAKIMRVLISAIVIALLVLVIVVCVKKGSNDENIPNTAVAQNEPVFDSPKPETIKENALPELQETAPAVAETAQEIPVIQEQAPAAAETAQEVPVIQEQAPAIAAVAPPTQVEKPAKQESKPIQVIEKPAKQESKPIQVIEKPAKQESKPIQVVKTPAPPESKPATTKPTTGNVNAQLQPVRDAINKKDMNGAWELLQPILKANPNNPTVLNMAVQIATRQGNHEKALESLKKLESTNGSKAAYWRQRAKLHQALGQTDEARNAEEKANSL